MKFLIIVSLTVFTSISFSWDYRGHSTLCEAAAFLVKTPELKKFLRQRPQEMGHLCNIPDTSWKGLGPEINKLGSSSHYLDPEVIGLQVKDIPTDYKKIVDKYTGQKNMFADGTIHSVPNDFGSNWWRADQFYRLAVRSGNLWKNGPLPEKNQERDDDFHFNRSIYNFYVNLGIMGHFVGDNAQPFHMTADYDGYKVGHGGIHAYYEGELVSAQPPELLPWLVEQGEKIIKSPSKEERAMFEAKTVVEKMKKLGEMSYQDVPKILSMDPVVKPSVQKNDKGMKIKTIAERKSPESQAEKFRPLIVTHMARGAVLLAHLWDKAYLEAKEPKLSAYKSFRFPFEPTFIAPDYFDLKLVEVKK